jgi:hypothetical protein
MLRVIGHIGSFIDEKNRHTVLDAIGAPQSGVVQQLVADQQERSPVLGADENTQQLFVEHEGSDQPGLGMICWPPVNGAGAPPMAMP